MKLKTRIFRRQEGGYCVSVVYNPVNRNEIVAVYDDKTMVEIDTMDVEQIAPVIQLGVHVTCISWSPSMLATSNISSPSMQILAAVCSDGSLRLFQKDGSLEKKVPSAHSGAGICVSWNNDGSIIASSGEDGVVRLWSRSLNPRTKLVSYGQPIHSLAWGSIRSKRNAFSEAIAVAHGNRISIIQIQNSSETVEWEGFAQERGTILSIDWNNVNDHVIAGGEDCCYRIFNTSGFCLYVSSALHHAITCVSWQPCGQSFVVGSYNSLCLCDSSGWIYEQKQLSVGSIVKTSWRSDGMQFSGASANGSVVVGNIVGQSKYYGNYIATVADSSRVEVITEGKQDVNELDLLGDEVTHFSITSMFLIVCTMSRCIIQNILKWSTTSSINMNLSVYGIISSEKYFGLVTMTEFQIYSFQGRLVSNVQCQGFRGSIFTVDMASMSFSTLAVLEQERSECIQLFDAMTGKLLKGEVSKINHIIPIKSISLSQDNRGSTNLLLTFLDVKNDLYITPISRSKTSISTSTNLIKVSSQINSFAWGCERNSRILAALSGSQCILWYDVNGLFLDKKLSLIAKENVHVSSQTRGSTILTFQSSSIITRFQDGSRVRIGFSHVAPLIHDLTLSSKWEPAIKVCSMAKSDSLWAILAGIALHCNQLEHLEVALCALREIARVQHIRKIQSIERNEHRSAELMLYKHLSPNHVIDLLVSANPPLFYRAIKVYINLHHWSDALELATEDLHENEWYLIILLWYRKRFLMHSGSEETNSDFHKYLKQYENVLSDEERIRERKKMFKNKEREGAA